MIDNLNGSEGQLGDCYDEEASFLIVTTQDKADPQWGKVMDSTFTFYQASLIKTAQEVLRGRYLPADVQDADDYASRAWEKFIEHRETLVWEGDGTIFRCLYHFIDNAARVERRRRTKHPTETFTDIEERFERHWAQRGSASSMADSAAENELPATSDAESMMTNRQIVRAVRRAVALTFHAIPPAAAKMCALYFYMGWEQRAIAQHLGKTDVRNPLTKAKRLFLVTFYQELQRLDRDDAHSQIQELIALLLDYDPLDTDGRALAYPTDVTPPKTVQRRSQKHPFVLRLCAFIAHDEFNPDVPHWLDGFIDSLLNRQLDDYQG